MSRSFSRHAAAYLRAEMARAEVNSQALASRLGVSDMWVSRRMRGLTHITVDDIERISAALGIPAGGFLPESERVA